MALKDREKLRQYQKAYYAAHRESLKARQRKRYQDNHAAAAEYSKRYRRENLVALADKKRLYRESNRTALSAAQSRYAKAHREEIAAKLKAYNKSHPEVKRLAHQKRRARKRQAVIGSIAAIAAWEKHWRAKTSARCYWCGRRTKVADCHADHVVPLAKGGSHDVSNLVIACSACNMRKHAKLPEEFNRQLTQPLLFV